MHYNCSEGTRSWRVHTSYNGGHLRAAAALTGGACATAVECDLSSDQPDNQSWSSRPVSFGHQSSHKDHAGFNLQENVVRRAVDNCERFSVQYRSCSSIFLLYGFLSGRDQRPQFEAGGEHRRNVGPGLTLLR